jgi:hypothetical protein
MPLSQPNALTAPQSRPDRWLVPHQTLDPVARRMTYGKIRPMEEDTLFATFARWLRKV